MSAATDLAETLLAIREKYRVRMAIAKEKHARAVALHEELEGLYDPPREGIDHREPTIRQFTGEGCYDVPEATEAHRLISEWLRS